MPRLANPLAFHPVLQFRYIFITSALPLATIYARSAQQPSVDNSPVTVDHKNGYFKIKGRTKWNDITLQCYQFEGITAKEIWRYLNGKHQKISDAIDKDTDSYKKDMQLYILNPMSIPVGRWKLIGGFISSASWGDMDYGSNDVAQCTLTLSYDYAELI